MIRSQCAKCESKHCRNETFEAEMLPAFCPMKNLKEVIEGNLPRYGQGDIEKLYLAAAIQEKEAYECVRDITTPVRPRIREISELAKKMSVKNVGMAFCVGLSDEAYRATEILESHGLIVHSICCSCGAIDKVRLGVP